MSVWHERWVSVQLINGKLTRWKTFICQLLFAFASISVLTFLIHLAPGSCFASTLFIPLPRLLDPLFIRCYIFSSDPHSVLCTAWFFLWTVWSFVLQPYYPSSVPLLSCQILYLWSCISSQRLFLVPYLHGLFQHSIILLTLPLSLSIFLNSCSFHPGCCVAHWLPFHLASLNFSVTRSVHAKIVSFSSVMYSISTLGSKNFFKTVCLFYKLFFSTCFSAIWVGLLSIKLARFVISALFKTRRKDL